MDTYSDIWLTFDLSNTGLGFEIVMVEEKTIIQKIKKRTTHNLDGDIFMPTVIFLIELENFYNLFGNCFAGSLTGKSSI